MKQTLIGIGIMAGLLTGGLIPAIVIMVFLSNWGGVAGVIVTLIFCGIGFQAALMVALERPKLWLLWGNAFGAFLLVAVIEAAYGAAIDVRSLVGLAAFWMAGLVGSAFGARFARKREE